MRGVIVAVERHRSGDIASAIEWYLPVRVKDRANSSALSAPEQARRFQISTARDRASSDSSLHAAGGPMPMRGPAHARVSERNIRHTRTLCLIPDGHGSQDNLTSPTHPGHARPMLKPILLLSFTLCLASLAIPLTSPAVHAGATPTTQPAPATQPVPAVAAEEAPPTPAQAAPKQDDPWFPELRGLVETMSDASMDKSHVVRGICTGEPAASREMRLDHFTQGVLDAARGRAGELAQFGPDGAWKYAATLVCIAHKETRIASDYPRLGNQDNGKAHGYFQIWSWHGMDVYSADTALDMLIKEPTSSWALPAKHPWTGYPDCAKWLAKHPAPTVAPPADAP